MREIMSGLRVAFRSLAKQPGLALLAVLALGMGIGFTAIMYSIVHGALYRGLPFPDGDRIYAVLATNPSEGIDQTSISIHDYVDWRDQQSSMEELAAYYNGTINVTAGEGPSRYDGAFMTASAFRVLGVQPVLGRSFRDDEDRPGAPLVLILGHQVWTGRLRKRPRGSGSIGEGERRDGHRHRRHAGGVPLPQHRAGVGAPSGRSSGRRTRGAGISSPPSGSYRPDVSPEQAQTEFSGIAGRIAEQLPGDRTRGWTPR